MARHAARKGLLRQVLRIAGIRHQLVADRIYRRLVFLHHRAEFQVVNGPALLSVSSQSDEVQPALPSAHSYKKQPHFKILQKLLFL